MVSPLSDQIGTCANHVDSTYSGDKCAQMVDVSLQVVKSFVQYLVQYDVTVMW